VSIEFWLTLEPQTRRTRFAINILFITARAERKVRSYVKLFDFFPGWILIRLTWNLSRFVPNSAEILTQNFGKKLFRENFSEILCKPRLSSAKIVKFRPTFCNYFPGPACTEKIHKSTFVCCLNAGKVGRPLTNRRRKILGRKARTFCFRRTGFVHSRSGTYCALLPGYFGLKFLPDIRHNVYWVLAEIWAPDSSHKFHNKSFIHHCPGWKEGSYVCETVWFFSWVNTHPFDLKSVAFCPKFSGDSYAEFREKTISGEFFRNFVQTKAIL